MKKVFISGSLRNPKIPQLGVDIRDLGYEVFDDWFGCGPEADDNWQKYEHTRGRTYEEALDGQAAHNIFDLDFRNICTSDISILILPAGKSGHLELGFALGMGKKGYIFFPDGEPDRWDVMYLFATDVFFEREDLMKRLKGDLFDGNP